MCGTCGFRDLQLAVFHGPPYQVSLEDFEDFLAGGTATAPWVTSTRVFLRNARTFFLTKSGAERVDSRRADGLACHIHVAAIDVAVRVGTPIVIDALRDQPHSTHFTVSEALEAVARIAPRRTYLTHMSHDIDHEEVSRRLPPNVQLAYDGLAFPF